MTKLLPSLVGTLWYSIFKIVSSKDSLLQPIHMNRLYIIKQVYYMAEGKLILCQAVNIQHWESEKGNYSR